MCYFSSLAVISFSHQNSEERTFYLLHEPCVIILSAPSLQAPVKNGTTRLWQTWAPVACSVVSAFSKGAKKIQHTGAFAMLLSFCTDSCAGQEHTELQGCCVFTSRKKGVGLSGSTHRLRTVFICKYSSLVAWFRMTSEIHWISRIWGLATEVWSRNWVRWVFKAAFLTLLMGPHMAAIWGC